MQTCNTITEANILGWLEEIKDPEIPVLSIVDLGIVRAVDVQYDADQKPMVKVSITATYSGCPAMDMIAAEIKMQLHAKGIEQLTVTNTLTETWTTDWMTAHGKQQLLQYGIAPPEKRFAIPGDGVPCPRCYSDNTRLLSEFSSTACKAMYQCNNCLEPFDYFKCH